MADDKEITITEDLKDLVAARLDLLSPDLAISIGSSGTFTKAQLIEHVRQGDNVGRTIIEMEMEFQKDFIQWDGVKDIHYYMMPHLYMDYILKKLLVLLTIVKSQM